MATPADVMPVYPDPVFGTWEMQPLSWIVALAIPSCFALAMVMGANDVGNAFGTSVGAGVLTVKMACGIAAVFDFIGAIALGQGVASTIRKGIVDVDMFTDVPELLMFGNWCSVVGAAAWVAIATVFSLPVSSTHAVIGSILGFALVEFGASGVDWMGVLKIVISWFASPVLAGVIAASMFTMTRYVILRQDTSVALIRARWYASALTGFVVFLAGVFVATEKAEKGTWQSWGFPLISLGVAVIVFLWMWLTPFGIDLLFRVFKPASVRENDRLVNKAASDAAAETGSHHDMDVPTGAVEMRSGSTHSAIDDKKVLERKMMAESSAELNFDDDGSEINQNEMFDETVESRFAAVQVLTAAYLSFCHGANDIANVAGPMASIWQIYETGVVESKANTPIWILGVMGLGIVVGLFFFGYKIIQTMGKDMTYVTPSRGFSMEMGTATSVLIASYAKIPVSTTQAAVGSVVSVGFLGGAGRKGVNWKLFSGIIASWVITLPVAGGISAFIYWLLRPVVVAVFPH